jgi:hypothetical protein
MLQKSMVFPRARESRKTGKEGAFSREKDWFGDYPQKDVIDPQGPENGRERVIPEIPEFEGAVYQTLSAVAKAITGSHTNGYLFFRLLRKGDST